MMEENTVPNTTTGVENLQPGDLFFATDTDGVTYKVPFSEIEDIIQFPIAVHHIKNIRRGTVIPTEYDYITNVDGDPVSNTSFTSGEWLVWGDRTVFGSSTSADWDFGPLSNTQYRTNFGDFLKGCAYFNGDMQYISVDRAEDISYMFNECKVFNRSVAHFNTSKVHTMRALFRQCHAFNQDVNHFDTSACENFQILFQGCGAFRGALDNWDVSQVTTFHQMFAATKYTPDLSSWEPLRAITFEGMFQNSDFNGNISGWNTSNVSRMDAMFNGNTRFSQNLSQWCVPKIKSKPNKFDNNATSLPASYHPRWGTCPRGEDKE